MGSGRGLWEDSRNTRSLTYNYAVHAINTFKQCHEVTGHCMPRILLENTSMCNVNYMTLQAQAAGMSACKNKDSGDAILVTARLYTVYESRTVVYCFPSSTHTTPTSLKCSSGTVSFKR